MSTERIFFVPCQTPPINSRKHSRNEFVEDHEEQLNLPEALIRRSG